MARLLKMRKRKHFGTDGIRGSISKETNPEFILKLGWAAGKVFKEQGIKALIIGKDTRISGYMLETALQSGIIACLLYTSPSPRDREKSRMPSSA